MSSRELVRPLLHLPTLAVLAAGLIGCGDDYVVESDMSYAETVTPASPSFGSGPATSRSGGIGISPHAPLAELYEFLQAQPSPDDNWAPIAAEEECSKDWVVWTPGPDDPNDPDPPAERRDCLGRWRASNADWCTSEATCGCAQFATCFSGRKAVESCDLFPGACSQIVFQKNVPADQRNGENLNCRLQTRDIARNAADGGPYHYRWIITAGGGFNFVCKAQYMVTPRRVVTGAECGCQTVGTCQCATEQLASGVGLTQPAGVAELTAQTDLNEDMLGAASCETFQEQASLAPQARHDALTLGLATGDSQSHSAFEYTLRLMHELDMVRPTATELVGSGLAFPQCGVLGWLSVAPSCAAEVPATPFARSNNCARLLSSHVQGGTITEDVFRACTDALRTISLNPYTDTACGQDVKAQVAAFATALRDKAIGLALSLASQENDR